MKKIAFALIFWAFLSLHNQVSAATSPTLKITTSPVASSSPVPTDVSVIEKLKKIETLKEKIATKVAEIREKEKGAVSGLVKKIEKNSLNIAKASGDQTVAYSEDTIFYTFKNGGRQEIKSSVIKENDTVTAFGYFDQTKMTFSAKYIYLEDLPLHIRGKVSDIDKTNFTITVKEKHGNIIVDVETYTKTLIYDRNKNSFISGGFSKIKLGDAVHLIGTANPKIENRVSAKKLYVISFPNQPTVAQQPTITVNPTPSITKKSDL